MPESSTKPVKHKKPKSKRSFGSLAKKLAIVAMVSAVLAGLAFGVYKLLIDKDENVPAQNESQSAPAPPAEEAAADAQPLTESYSSPTLRMDFMYPSDWTVNEADRAITVTSPDFTYADIEGQEINGHFRLYIRKGTDSSDSKYLGRGFAIKPSEKISYSQPESGQRKDTFLTAFGLDKPDNFAYFIVQGNFDLKKGDTLGPDYAKEPDAYLIAGGYSTAEAVDGLGTNQLAINSYDQSSQYKTAVLIVESLKLR